MLSGGVRAAFSRTRFLGATKATPAERAHTYRHIYLRRPYGRITRYYRHDNNARTGSAPLS